MKNTLQRKLLPFFIWLLLAFIQPKISISQPYGVGHIKKSFTDAARSNRTVTTEIYYPAASTGDNVAAAQGNFPVLVFGHGFVMSWNAYKYLWDALVPKGYIMVFPTTETSLSPSHDAFGKDMAFLVNAMQTEGQTPGSHWNSIVSAKSAVMGHSMGGGSAFLAIQYNSNITVLATLAAAETNPSAIAAAASITIPSLVLSGGNDCVTPPASHQMPMYQALGSSCKSYVTIKGGGHCRFADYNFNCYLGEGTCSPQATISESEQHNQATSLIVPWLDFFLKDDCSGGDTFMQYLSVNTAVTSQQNCSMICVGTETSKEQRGCMVSFDGSRGTVEIDCQRGLQDGTFQLYGLSGNIHRNFKGLSGNESSIVPERMAPGLYFFILADKYGFRKTGKINVR